MLSKKMEEALNTQITAEFWSAHLYLSMSAHFAAEGLQGFANWMKIQYQEEVTHGLKLFNYILDRGGHPMLKAIDAVPTSWPSPLAVFENSLQHEQKVTAMINHLVDIATEEKDHATQSMLKWFVDEQVEEEANATQIIDSLKLIKDNGFGLYSIDKDLATRTFVDETAEAE